MKGHEYRDFSSHCRKFVTHRKLIFTVTATSNCQPCIYTAAQTLNTFAPLDA